ncbi:MAG: hypothetical protein E7089_05355 [Bacteroidales bacterium]|nr:hypothetical protein [Bacteroidales bacterium]
MIKHIKPLPISEEMLGAYLEGKLAQNDALYVEQMLQNNDELSAFVNELSVSDDLTSNYLMEDIPSFNNYFILPNISKNTETFTEPHITPIECEPSFVDVAACAMIAGLTDDGDMIINDNLINIDIDNISDIGMDDLPIDGE